MIKTNKIFFLVFQKNFSDQLASFDEFCNKVFVLQTMNQQIFKIVPHSKNTAVEK